MGGLDETPGKDHPTERPTFFKRPFFLKPRLSFYNVKQTHPKTSLIKDHVRLVLDSRGDFHYFQTTLVGD